MTHTSPPTTRRAGGVVDEVDLRELVRLGTLAASSHNSQPWHFRIVDAATIEVRPDLSRRCPAVDPDDAHLFRSLGCAVENIVQAASTHRLRVDVEVDGTQPLIRLELHDDPDVRPSRLAAAIGDRQSTRSAFDGRPADPDVIRALEEAALGDGVRAIMLTDPGRIRMAAQFVERGNAHQLADPAFRRELVEWIRANDREARATGDGLWSRVIGAPSIPSPLARWVLRLALRPASQIQRDTEAIESSSGLAVLVGRGDDLSDWVETGRSVERMMLSATADGLRTAFVNQPLEVAWLRPEFERWLGLRDERAHVMIRFGHAAPMPFSLRRPVADVLVDERRSTGTRGVRRPVTAPRSFSGTARYVTAPDADRPVDDEEVDEEVDALDVPFEAPLADVLDQRRVVPLGLEEEAR